MTSQVFTFPALVRSRERERFCTVSAARNLEPNSGQFFRSPIKILDPADDFPDGTYELVLGAQTFVLTKRGGKYQPIP